MCQLLLIDPSAWTRWHSPGNAAPPHVYRALEWFLILEGKTDLHPRMADLYLKGNKPPDDQVNLAVQLADLRLQISRLKRWLWAASAVAGLSVTLAFAVFR